MSLKPDKMLKSKGDLTWRDGLRIVDLGELAKQMYCKQCGSVLELSRTATETRFALASVLRIVCAKCSTITEVHTSKSTLSATFEGAARFDVNEAASIDILLQLKAGGTGNAVVNFLALLNIPLDSSSCTNTDRAEHEQYGTEKGQSQTDASVAHHSGEASHTRTTNPQSSGTERENVAESCSTSTAGHTTPLVSDPEHLCEALPETDHSECRKVVPVSETQSLFDPAKEPESAERRNMSKRKRNRSRQTRRTAKLMKKEPQAQRVPARSETKTCKKKTEEVSVKRRSSLRVPKSGHSPPIRETRQSHEQIRMGSRRTTGSTRSAKTLSRKPSRETRQSCEQTKMGSRHTSGSSTRSAKTLRGKRGFDADQLLSVAFQEQPIASKGDSAENGIDEVDAESSMDGTAQPKKSDSSPSISEKVLNKSLQQHKSNAKEGKQCHTYRFHCKECDRYFTYSAEYATHMRETHGIEKPHKCRKCPEAFSTENQLKVHRKSHPPVEPEGTYECSICLKIFPNGRQLRAHRTTHTREERLRPLKRYKCDVCDEEFQKNYFLQIHMRYHTGEKPYKCFNCDAAFITKPQRTTHFKKCIAKKKTYLCELCGGRFGSTCTLRKHERVHTGEKPHKCRYCEQSFGRRNTLKIHERQHTGERPYVCDQCAAAFKQRVSLVTHMRNKHNINATLYSQPRDGPRFTHAHFTTEKPSPTGKKSPVLTKPTPVSVGISVGVTDPPHGNMNTMSDVTTCASSFVPRPMIMLPNVPLVPEPLEESSNIITLAHAASVLAPVSTISHPSPVAQPVASMSHISLMKDDDGIGDISRAAADLMSFPPIARYVHITQDMPMVGAPDDGRVMPVVQEENAVDSLQTQDPNTLIICPNTLPQGYESVYYN